MKTIHLAERRFNRRKLFLKLILIFAYIIMIPLANATISFLISSILLAILHYYVIKSLQYMEKDKELLIAYYINEIEAKEDSSNYKNPH